MKKQLLLSAVALFSVVGVSAQLATITQEWKTSLLYLFPVFDFAGFYMGYSACGDTSRSNGRRGCCL